MKTNVQIVQHMRPGGIECLALDLLSTPPSGDRGLLISLEGTMEEAVANWPRLQQYSGRLVFLDKKPGTSLRLIWRLARLLSREGADVVHTHHVGPMIYGGIAARLAGVRRLVHTEHDAWHLQDPKRARLVRRIWKLVNPRLVADAELVADQVARLARIPVDAVIRNGVDLLRFRPGGRTAARAALALPARVQIVGLAGRLNKVKNQSAAIRALDQMADTAVHLAIAGDGEERAALQQLADTLGLSDRVHFLGHLDGVEQFYRAIDCLCLPSHSEGFPLTLIEAQACGLPVVATRVGGVPEAVCPETGRLVEAGDIGALSEALTAALQNTDPSVARRFAESRGSLDRMLSAYGQVMA
ncbi:MULTISPECIES: glycosyltransferase [unclassified Minwuia]|uniref:glycosyltransferase n=1 Tax=unclassified Minwuia TaxID=2618799 RepID=UPI002478C876|nr:MULTISPECIES: glycosyltransferase [unclassified Minwuia]